MISFILFILFAYTTPVLLLRFIKNMNNREKIARSGVYAAVSFLGMSVFAIKGSLLGAGILFLCGLLATTAGFTAVFIRSVIAKRKNNGYLAVSLCIFGITTVAVLIISAVYHSILTGLIILLGCVGIIAFLTLWVLLAAKQYGKSEIFKGVCNQLVYFVFFVGGSCVVMTYIFNGLAEVMHHYTLSTNSSFLKTWWVIPALFALLAARMTVASDLKVYGKRLVGSIIAHAAVIMILGECVKNFLSTNFVSIIRMLIDLLKQGIHEQEILMGISMVIDLFCVYGIVMVIAWAVAFLVTLYKQHKSKLNDGISQNGSVSVEKMKKSDAYTIANGTSSRELMKRAAQGVFDSAEWEGKSVAIVAGSGNNAGDGYALAQILAETGNIPTIFRVSEKFSEDGKFYFEQAESAGVKAVMFDEKTDLTQFDIVVDCILGIGFSGVPEGVFADAITKINESGAYVISVDINSGLNGDSGEAEIAVKSDLTVSVGCYKNGMFAGKAPELIGKLVNVDIGIVWV